MLYVGVDYHKRYSQVNVVDERGESRARARLSNEFDEIETFFKSLGEPCKVVVEACWNWGLIYDWLEKMGSVTEVQLAHPTRTRAIAAAQIKTDAIDAHTLAQLLRANLIPRAYVPSPETRRMKQIVRQRLFMVRLRTMVKNRIHSLLNRHHVPLPPVSDLFGRQGRTYLSQVVLPSSDQHLLTQALRLFDKLSEELKRTETWLQDNVKGDRRVELLRSVPGLGPFLAPVVALEIDTIKRFASPSKLAAYAGLVPSTRASGGHTFHGGLLKQSNKWLRWALVEAAWVAVRRDPPYHWVDLLD